MRRKPIDRTLLEPRDVQGPRIVLQPTSMAIADDLLEACLESRKDVMPYMPWDCWTAAETVGFLAEADQARAEGSRFEFAICHVEDGRFIGMLALKVIDPFTPVGELGYWVRTAEVGKGYATEAVGTITAACAREGQFKRLEAWAATTNHASRRVLTANGFQEFTLKPLGQCCHGQWHDLLQHIHELTPGEDAD